MQYRAFGRSGLTCSALGFGCMRLPTIGGDRSNIDEPLATRSDDSDDVIRRRLEVYAAQTAPVVEYYERTDRLLAVDGAGSVDAVAQAVSAALDGGQ